MENGIIGGAGQYICVEKYGAGPSLGTKSVAPGRLKGSRILKRGSIIGPDDAVIVSTDNKRRRERRQLPSRSCLRIRQNARPTSPPCSCRRVYLRARRANIYRRYTSNGGGARYPVCAAPSGETTHKKEAPLDQFRGSVLSMLRGIRGGFRYLRYKEWAWPCATVLRANPTNVAQGETRLRRPQSVA